MEAMPRNTANAENPAKSNMSQPRSIEGAQRFPTTPRTYTLNQSRLTLELSPAEVKPTSSVTIPSLSGALDMSIER